MFTDELGRAVRRAEGTRIGKVDDLIVVLGDPDPHVVALRVRVGRRFSPGSVVGGRFVRGRDRDHGRSDRGRACRRRTPARARRPRHADLRPWRSAADAGRGHRARVAGSRASSGGGRHRCGAVAAPPWSRCLRAAGGGQGHPVERAPPHIRAWPRGSARNTDRARAHPDRRGACGAWCAASAPCEITALRSNPTQCRGQGAGARGRHSGKPAASPLRARPSIPSPCSVVARCSCSWPCSDRGCWPGCRTTTHPASPRIRSSGPTTATSSCGFSASRRSRSSSSTNSVHAWASSPDRG